MFNSRRLVKFVFGLALLAMTASQVTAQGGRGFGGGRGYRGGRGGGPPGQDARFVKDRDDFHYLLQHHDQIRRTVTNRDDGVETLTESDNAEIAAKIQEHVDAMYGRVEDGRPIHMRDPLFAEVFRHADKIKMEVESTDKGVRVIETSDDPYVARLIQAHAEVVDLFVKNGFGEPHKNHAVPKRDEAIATPTSTGQVSVDSDDASDAGPPCPAAACPASGTCPNAAKCPSAEECPNAAKCPSTKPACCSDKACKGAACPLSDVCPNAKQTSAPGNACDADKPCADGACPASGTCPNAAKCPSAKPACCADKACKGAACPLSDVCPNAKQTSAAAGACNADKPCADGACPASGTCPNAAKCPSAKPACCADKACKGAACPLSDVCPNAKQTSAAGNACDANKPCAGGACPASGNCPNAAKCASAKAACCADEACKGAACPLNSETQVAEETKPSSN